MSAWIGLVALVALAPGAAPSVPAGAPVAPVASAAVSTAPDVAPTEIVVHAPPSQTIAEFVEKFSAPTGQDGRLARWSGSVCPGVIGLAQKYGEYMNDKLAATAQAVGLKVGEPGCDPNIMIVVTGDTDRVMQELSKRYRRVLAVHPGSDEITTGGSGKETFDDFVKTPRPVRWWHVSQRVPADGSPEINQTVRVFSPSRLRSVMREDLHHVVIIVDAKSAAGVNYEALASYVSMVALAQLSPNAGVSRLPTILSLFKDKDAGRPAPNDLTTWDLGYLKGLYAARTDAPDLLTQTRDITKAMQKPEPAGH